MRFHPALLGVMLMMGVSFAEEVHPPLPDIEVKVCFFEMQQDTTQTPDFTWMLLDSWEAKDQGESQAADVTDVLSQLALSAKDALMAGPSIRTQSGSNAIVKVVTEYIYPTDFEVRTETSTAETNTVRGFAVVPCKYETRDVGITLNVTPRYNPKRDMIDLKLMAEVVSEPTWNNYAATYVDMNGVSQTVNLRQPFFHTRKVDQTISLRNRTTVMMGGMVTSGKRQVEERIPVLGRIPLLGRLFCRSYEVDDSRKLLITVTASVVPDL